MLHIYRMIYIIMIYIIIYIVIIVVSGKIRVKVLPCPGVLRTVTEP